MADVRTRRPRGAQWLRGFIRIISGEHAAVPDELFQPLAAGVRAVRRIHRLPWQVELPTSAVATAPFPKLVISGDHNAAFEAVCDSLAEQLGADRAHVVGAGHTTPHTGAAFNND